MTAKKLTIKYCGKIIDQLGIQMYQSAVAAVAEIITNSWDADAGHVRVTLPERLDDSACIIIEDDGIGMSFDDCENRYLNVGYCRRGDSAIEKTKEKQRPVLGRKGIGKFAGFGIAETVNIRTVSKESQELTEFQLKLSELRTNEYVSTASPIGVLRYEENVTNEQHGTRITLRSLKLGRAPSESVFLRSMARRFLLHRRAEDFRVTINGAELPETEEEQDVEFVFPRDYTEDECYDKLNIDSGWGTEDLDDGNTIKWRICFYQKPIDEEQLRGISLYSNGKLSQTPFFFNLAGGLGGQHGQEYMTGAVEADYLDEQERDLISPERQRVDFEQPESEALLNWGREKIKSLLRLWQKRRAQEKVNKLEQRILPFNARLDRLSATEKRTVKKAITNLAKVPSLDESDFIDLGKAILTTWEEGRLHDLIDSIADNDSLNEKEFLQLLIETQALTALNIAEAIKTKIKAIQALKDFIANRDKENTIRDHVAENPWLISPQWETFQKERKVKKLIEDAAAEVGLNDNIYQGRIDLALSSGNQLLILEFMRPGLPLDFDHLNRFEQYIYQVRSKVEANSKASFTRILGHVVADSLGRKAGFCQKINALKKEDMFCMDWNTLLAYAVDEYRDYIQILHSRSPDDLRLNALLD